MTKRVLENELTQGRQPLLDTVEPFKGILQDETVWREFFKYNQIFLKLSRQFISNTVSPKLKDIGDAEDDRFFDLDNIFKELQETATEDYLQKRLKSIDLALFERKIMDSSQLNFIHNNAVHLEIKAMDKKFGEIAVKNQFSTKRIIDNALSEQTRLYLQTKKNHIIGDILVTRKEMTPEIRDEILLIQNRILEEDWASLLRESAANVIQEQEKNALFGAILLKEKLMNEQDVLAALQLQKLERKAYEDHQKEAVGSNKEDLPPPQKPRWIGDILVEDYGLSEKNREKIVAKQLKQKIKIINIKMGGNIKSAHQEMIRELDSYFQVHYTQNRLQAFIKLNKEIPSSMTSMNIMLWLYQKKITKGLINPSIYSLLENKVKPGDKVMIAKGEAPVHDKLTPNLHFKKGDDLKPVIVHKKKRLASIHRTLGQAGINVNQCFIAKHVEACPIQTGPNVIRKNNEFFAACDGVPDFSEKGVLSISPVIEIPGDLDDTGPKINHDCEVYVHGVISSSGKIKCKKLTAGGVKGATVSLDKITVKELIEDARINASGEVHLSSIRNSEVTSLRTVLVQKKQTGTNPQDSLSVSHSIINSDDVCIFTDVDITSSMIRVKNKIILRKVTVENDCKLVAGDSLEVIDQKKDIERIEKEKNRVKENIESLEQQLKELFSSLEKKDISDFETEVLLLNNRRQKTKADLDRIRKLKKKIRALKKESEKEYNECGDMFLNMSQRISDEKRRVEELEQEKTLIQKKIIGMYKQEKSRPEIDARKAVIAKGTVIQFRFTSLTLESDSTGFVFREEYDTLLGRYEIKQHRW
ncbi:MAG: FapA family protein [Desulfobacterales bacterium]|nr:FapA family protein [Desulfobacterales bacterium]